MLSPEVEVTRSLSNLYKQRYISNDQGPRIINSNLKVAERMKELERMMMSQIPDQQGSVDGFIAGLQMEVVDVVPKEPELTPEEIKKQAEEEADGILADAREQMEAIISDAQNQAEAIKEQARNEGFAAGEQEGNAKANVRLEELSRQLDEESRRLEEDYQQKIQELEPYLVDIISDIFEKVFHVQFDDKKEILIYLIQKVILSAEGTKEFQVRVSLKDYEFVEEHKKYITDQVGQAVHVEIMADAALQERQCMIETDSGVFECGMDVQLENLTKTIKSLSL